MTTPDKLKCGYVAILGRPNVGKSTLLNQMLGQKISITSRKPQTTRHKLLGIKSTESTQILFVDTPGIHSVEPRAINRYMNKSARSAVADVDVILFLVDRDKWTEDDDQVARLLEKVDTHKIIVVNKIDRLEDRPRLLRLMSKLQTQFPEADIVPVSAESGDNLETLENLIIRYLPTSPFYFDKSQITDRSERFLVAEIIREKLMRQLGDELPYSLTIQIESFTQKNDVIHIEATIYVEKEGQKRILIGQGGERLKRVGSDARKDIELVLDSRVMLNTWVKVKASWSDDDRALKSLGYDDL